MKNDLPIKNGIIIPGNELEVMASRAGGPGGQHVNKTSTRITVRWNLKNSSAFSDEQKVLLLKNLASQLTTEGDVIVHNSTSRSQLQNKEQAFEHLATLIRKALHVPKKRIKTKIPKSAQEKRLQSKSRMSTIKKLRSKKNLITE